MKKKLPAITLAALLLSGGAGAQAIYRCGDSYSQKPCAGGSVVQADDSRTADQKAQAEAAVRRDAKMASAMEKDREKLQAQAVPGYIPAARTPAPAAGPDKKKPPKKTKPKKTPEYFTAVAPVKPGEKPAGKKTAKSKKPA